ncbi:hypothetical protein CLV98_103156 [Dyadobacter jejuensis]|uniref:DinB family protein n=1 Tax=Dyadobacter jejuensis TaxID=1082580 RepID=A0A316ANA4_9BACT|nr:hypothetical protein [Dyadobacter jejuensis]PWJ58789.1 hypothetical protein CLV98_103156 [Dyadobacter jejuensis]
MTLKEPIRQLIYQLKYAIEQLEPQEYSMALSALSNASIGQHIRHIIELFQELEKGYQVGTVNYELRERDYKIETSPAFALEMLKKIENSVAKEDKVMTLISDYNLQCSEPISLTTTYYRELIYNIEHTVHHMALIRVGWGQVCVHPLPKEFGVAVSTLKYRQAITQ